MGVGVWVCGLSLKLTWTEYPPAGGVLEHKELNLAPSTINGRHKFLCVPFTNCIYPLAGGVLEHDKPELQPLTAAIAATTPRVHQVTCIIINCINFLFYFIHQSMQLTCIYSICRRVAGARGDEAGRCIILPNFNISHIYINVHPPAGGVLEHVELRLDGAL